ncbi:MAG: hypothetical protein HQ485_14455 [Acidobacteria bacterium]|jgi:hypothetical protein|nr:hypothetical protein [Acidobacteriota bacterium]
MQKLTLTVDRHVVARAKKYARTRGTSVSRLVETMLDLAARSDTADHAGELGHPQPPVLTRLRGSLKGGSDADYLQYLEEKHR